MVADALKDYEEELHDLYEDTSKKWAEVSDEAEAAGFSIVALEKQYEEHMRRSGIPTQEDEVGGRGGEVVEVAMDGNDGVGPSSALAACRKCGRRSRTASLPPLQRTGSSGLVREALNGLCHLCAASAELDARAPVEKKHGKVLEKGASGFTGWTSGLQRTSDEATLKRMYKAKRPDDVARLASELAVEGVLEVDEVAGSGDEEGAQAVEEVGWPQ